MADLIDRLEITELLNRHQIYIDLADADGYAGLYAANGVYESPFPAHSHQRREPGPNATPGLAGLVPPDHKDILAAWRSRFRCASNWPLQSDLAREP